MAKLPSLRRVSETHLRAARHHLRIAGDLMQQSGDHGGESDTFNLIYELTRMIAESMGDLPKTPRQMKGQTSLTELETSKRDTEAAQGRSTGSTAHITWDRCKAH